ncbi:MAG: hypothetical protein HY717_05625 [Planctomycetes bacterium]|nr:hypothetical protein [Planctomycetota bacterium]
MSKTIVERIIEESKARVACREALKQMSGREGPSGDPFLKERQNITSELVFIEAFLNRFSAEVIPMITRAVSQEIASSIKPLQVEIAEYRKVAGPAGPPALPTPERNGGAAPSAAERPGIMTALSSSAQPIGNGDDSDIDTDLEIPLDEIKEQLLKVLSDPEARGQVEGTSLIDEAQTLAEEHLAPGAEMIGPESRAEPDPRGEISLQIVEALHQALSREMEASPPAPPAFQPAPEEGPPGPISSPQVKTETLRPGAEAPAATAPARGDATAAGAAGEPGTAAASGAPEAPAAPAATASREASEPKEAPSPAAAGIDGTAGLETLK